MSKRYLTNKELINDIAKSHQLSEAFILTAIEYYAGEVMHGERWSEKSLINFDLWEGIARDAKSRIDHRNEG